MTDDELLKNAAISILNGTELGEIALEGYAKSISVVPAGVNQYEGVISFYVFEEDKLNMMHLNNSKFALVRIKE